MSEIWKIHKSGYEVSNLGNIRGKRKFKDNHIMKLSLNHKGYYFLNVNKKSVFVHRLVVETFVGDVPKGNQVNHINGIKTNNNLSNLEIVTASQNRFHAYRIGLQFGPRGEKNFNCRLSRENILEIYSMFLNYYSNSQISEKFKITKHYVEQLRGGTKWKHEFRIYFKDVKPPKRIMKNKI